MFQESLFESSHALQTGSRWPAIASFAAQAIVVAALIAFPLLHPDVLLPRSFTLSVAPPAPPRVPIVEQVPRVRLTPVVSTNAPSAPAAARTEAPRINTHSFPAGATSSEDPPTTTGLNLGSSANPSVLPIGNGEGGSRPSIVVGSGGPGTGNSPYSVSKGVSAGLLLEPIRPTYPTIAKVARVSGTVTVEALISRVGRVESARATAGPDLLRAAAVDAVRSARYRPYLLNGQPTEVEASYTIHFNLTE